MTGRDGRRVLAALRVQAMELGGCPSPGEVERSAI